MAKEYARMMLMVFRKMDGIIKKEKQAEWLNTPNEALDNKTPLEIILKKPTMLQEVFLILYRIEWGISE